MKNPNWRLYLLALVLALALFVLWQTLGPGKTELPAPPASLVSPEAVVPAPLPRVLVLYQQGEGESDLAAFVGKELAAACKDKVVFRLINVLDEPQLVEFYSLKSAPAFVFLFPNGKIFRKYEGYLDKKKILAIVAQMNKS